MKTINDILEIAKSKRDEALEIITKERMRKYPSNKRIQQLQGQIEAYNFVVELIKREV